MRRVAWCAGALVFLASHAAIALDSVYPDWIRMKDSSAVRCRILSDNDGVVEAVMKGGQGEEKVTIDRTQIEWLQRNSPPRPVQREKVGGAFPLRVRP